MDLRRIACLVRKELLNVWSDPKSRYSILMPPIIQLCIFTFAATLDVKNAEIGILNRDNGEMGFELVQRFHGSPNFAHLHYLESVEEITPFIDEQKGIFVLSIDEQFSRRLNANLPTSLQLILDGRKSNTAQIAAGYANEIIQRFQQDRLPQDEPPIELIDRSWYNPNLLYPWYNVPCLAAILCMLTCLIVTSSSVAREREIGTFDQLLVSPLSPLEMLLGKTIPGILIGLLESSIILVVGTLLFGVPFTGSLFLFYVSLFFFVSAMSGIGLFISSLCMTQQQAILGTFAFMVPSVLLSGFATPIENMPLWLQPVTYLLPLRYMLVISKGLFLKAMPLANVLHQLWPILLIGCGNLIGAAWFFKKRLP